MSRLVGLCLALGSFWLSAASAHGQATEAVEELRAVRDSLRPLLEQARSALEARTTRAQAAQRAAAAALAKVDTSYVGGAMVLTPIEQREATRALFDEVWSESFSELGESPALSRSVIVFQQSDETKPIYVDGAAHRLILKPWTSRARVVESVRNAIAGAMIHDLSEPPLSVGRWSGNPLVPEPMDAVYRRVATTRSDASRACLGGEISECESALGLGTSRTVEQIRAWYAPDERRALVETGGNYDRTALPQRRACIDGSVDACDGLLARFTGDWTPLDRTVRASLLSHALEQGGEDAWTRLAEDPDMTPTEAIEHAARLPIDEVVAGWRDRLIEHRPQSFASLLPRSGLGLVWSLFFAALAMRSTRWRLG
ncbi:MAG: hypothetical protein OEN56_13980 [Gemmatimonadota bacterium]|nr:hypothetical protein [Gemmatimonadota bacterium]